MTYTADPDESHPQLALAMLVNTAFGTDIDAEKLRKFMVTHWPIVRKLAHNIHRNDERMKEYARMQNTQQQWPGRTEEDRTG